MCTFAATCLMPLGNIQLMTQHPPQPPELVTVQQPVDLQATPCLPENCPFKPHAYEEERLPQPSSRFPLQNKPRHHARHRLWTVWPRNLLWGLRWG